MEQTVFILIILSATIQASWNFLAKKFAGNKSAAICVGWFFLGLVFVPISSVFTDFSSFGENAFLLIVVTSFIHAVYIGLLGWGYAVGDISVVYPIARGLGIACTTAMTSLSGIDVLTLDGLLGISIIVLGSFSIASNELSKQNGKSIVLAVSIGLVISCYSVVDKLAAQTVPPFFLISIMNLLPPLILAPLLLTKFRKETLHVLRHEKKRSLIIGSGGSLAYLIILWAFQSTPAAYVVALREVSVVIASILGIVLLKEQLSPRKAIGIALIFIGSLVLGTI